MKTYGVKIPIAGHVHVYVEAADEKQAILRAMDNATLDDVEDWECIKQFQQGNVSYCPRPWEVEVTVEDEGDES